MLLETGKRGFFSWSDVCPSSFSAPKGLQITGIFRGHLWSQLDCITVEEFGTRQRRDRVASLLRESERVCVNGYLCKGDKSGEEGLGTEK